MKTPLQFNIVIRCFFIFWLVCIAFSVHAQGFILDWAKQFSGTNWEEGYDLTVDHDGNVYTMGRFIGTTDFDPGPGEHLHTTAFAQDTFNMFVTRLDASGNFVWSAHFGTEESEIIEGASMTHDADNNLYITGYFLERVDFDPGPDTFYLHAHGSWDAFVLKLNADGNLVWAHRIGGLGYHQGRAIAIDQAGDVVISGYYRGICDFDPGEDTFELNNYGSFDYGYVLKLNADGEFIWVKEIGGGPVLHSRCEGVAVDHDNNIYLTGSFELSGDFDPGPGTYMLEADSWDVFIVKLNSAGEFAWANRLGGSSVDYPAGIAVDAEGNVLTTGNFSGDVDFDPGDGVATLTSYTGGASGVDVFISKLDTDGNYLWAKQIGGINSDHARGIAVDASGNVYTTGEVWRSADYDPGPGVYSPPDYGHQDIFLSKLDPSGDFLWAAQLGSNTSDAGNAVFTGANGNVYLTGMFVGSPANFDPTRTKSELNSAGMADVFVAKFLPDSVSATKSINAPEPLITVFPNPASQIVTVSGHGVESSDLRIISTNGSVVYSSENVHLPASVPVAHFPQGQYILHANGGSLIFQVIQQ